KRQIKGGKSLSDLRFESLYPVCDNSIGTELITAFKKENRYLFRQSIKIGVQIYSLAVKEVVHQENSYNVFLFQFKNDSAFFEMETVEANAISIEVLSQHLREGLDCFLSQRVQQSQNEGTEQKITLPYRTHQLRLSQTQRIALLADKLVKNPSSLTGMDRNFLYQSIRGAANMYGFDAQELRTALQETGIIDAFGNSSYNLSQNTSVGYQNLIDQWLYEASVTYTNYFESLEDELRNIASTFLFNAYKNTIKVTEDSLEIGYLIAKDVVNIYHKNATYRSQKKTPPKGQNPDSYIPIEQFEVKKIKVEFEDEMINNIQVLGQRKSFENLSTSTKKMPPNIYLKILDQWVTIPTDSSKMLEKKGEIKQEIFWRDENQNVQGTIEIEVLNMRSNFGGDAKRGNGDDNKKKQKREARLSEIERELQNLDNTPSLSTSPSTPIPNDSIEALKNKRLKRKKLLDEQQKLKDQLGQFDGAQANIVSFDIRLILKIPLPGKYEYDFDNNQFIDGYRGTRGNKIDPYLLDAEIYLDPKGDQIFRTFKIKPFLMLTLSGELQKESDQSILQTLTRQEAKKLDDYEYVYNYAILDALDFYHGGGNVEIGRDADDYVTSITYPSPEGYVASFRLVTEKTSREDFIPGKGTLIFQNQHPISYSTRRDVTASSSKKTPKTRALYELDNEHFIDLDELLTNDAVFYNKTENYSPRNSVKVITDFNKPIPIYKEFARELLKAKIFSDFVGFDETNPNGLVQTEISKKLFLNTTAIPAFSNSLFTGYLNYIEPKLVISKIEEQNKFLDLSFAPIPAQTTGLDSTVFYVSSVDIMNYSNLQVGAQLSVAYFSIPKFHTRLELGIGGFINQSGFSNTLFEIDTLSNTTIRTENEFNGNSVIYYPEARLQFNPDPRFGFQFAYRPTFVTLLSSDVLQVDNEPRYLSSDGMINDRLYTHFFQLFAFIEVNKDGNGEFFFRSNFSMSSADRNNNFLQVQLGYAFNIFSTDKASPKKAQVKSAENQ
ncbi:MAG: hypothetical protein AAFU33_24145, partial [Bacteroidota bacterium]